MIRFGILNEASERARASRDTCQLLSYVTRASTQASTRAHTFQRADQSAEPARSPRPRLKGTRDKPVR